MAEVDQVTDRLPADPKIIQHLGFVLRQELHNGFQFNNDASEYKQVWSVPPVQCSTFVEAGQSRFGLE